VATAISFADGTVFINYLHQRIFRMSSVLKLLVPERHFLNCIACIRLLSYLLSPPKYRLNVVFFPYPVGAQAITGSARPRYVNRFLESLKFMFSRNTPHLLLQLGRLFGGDHLYGALPDTLVNFRKKI